MTSDPTIERGRAARRGPTRRGMLGLAGGAVLLTTGRGLAQARSGALKGVAGHDATGSVTLRKRGAAWSVEFSGDYSVTRAPDPYVGFGSPGRYARRTQFAKMRATSGAQSYRVPAGIDPTKHGAVWVWCKRFDVPIAVAAL